MAKTKVVTYNVSPLGNIGLDHVTRAALCPILVPVPAEAGVAGHAEGGGGEGAAGIAVPAMGPWVSRAGPTAVPEHSLTPLRLASARRDPHAAGGAVQMPGAAVRVAPAAAPGPPGVLPPQS